MRRASLGRPCGAGGHRPARAGAGRSGAARRAGRGPRGLGEPGRRESARPLRLAGGDKGRVGTVRAVGSEVTLFRPGGTIYYAGAIGRTGTDAERHVVDERIVGCKPATLTHAQAAALLLTTITAWELLFDGMHVPLANIGEGAASESLLVIGGVGSILIQLAATLTGLTVVTAASREETGDWCRKMGTHHVIDHREDLKAQLAQPGLVPRYAPSLTQTGGHFEAIVDLIASRGTIALIDDPKALDAVELKPKALTLMLYWGFTFARSAQTVPEMIAQHDPLNRVADLVDAGRVVSTANRDGGAVAAGDLRSAQIHQESGQTIAETVLKGFATA